MMVWAITGSCFHPRINYELPRNAMGKVQKNLLRDQHKGLFGGG